MACFQRCLPRPLSAVCCPIAPSCITRHPGLFAAAPSAVPISTPPSRSLLQNAFGFSIFFAMTGVLGVGSFCFLRDSFSDLRPFVGTFSHKLEPNVCEEQPQSSFGWAACYSPASHCTFLITPGFVFLDRPSQRLTDDSLFSLF